MIYEYRHEARKIFASRYGKNLEDFDNKWNGFIVSLAGRNMDFAGFRNSISKKAYIIGSFVKYLSYERRKDARRRWCEEENVRRYPCESQRKMTDEIDRQDLLTSIVSYTKTIGPLDKCLFQARLIRLFGYGDLIPECINSEISKTKYRIKMSRLFEKYREFYKKRYA